MRVEDPRPPTQGERTAELVLVLSRLWTYSATTKSDEARIYADEIAEAASRGFITTSVAPHGTIYGRLWKLTPSGLQFLFTNAGDPSITENAYVENHQG
jgi:hypothetical protein